MQKIKLLLPLVVALLLAFTGCKKKEAYTYETVPNDPLKVRIYTLDNGMKVYFSVNKDEPRVQAYVGVRVGGKNDPAETTGLAHYFEHLMFKGTKNFGTSNYAMEEPLLNQIEELFETYRKTTDEVERMAIYAQIDTISQEASKIAIPNEYDKLMASIGAQGSNAFTSNDVTAYVENIPSNEIESWAKIQADRFTNPVLRLFHTELETVYEEYNMSLTRDSWRASDALMAALYPHHPYGTQTILGSQEHLKNPSITNIKRYFETYYVPNNMAIIMVGDFDPDQTIKIIDQYFGGMEKKELPELKFAEEKPITEPIVKEIVGLEAENLLIGFRFPAAKTKDAAVLELVDYILTNGKAGLIDLNLVQQQKLLRAGSYADMMEEYSSFVMYGTPKEGQTLDEARELLLGQLELLKKGEFEEELLEAVINNFKLNTYYQQQYPSYTAYLMLNSFINRIEWKDEVNKIDEQSKITKQDVIDFANKYFQNNYAVIYKKEGKSDDRKIDKPQITPISTNRDEESDFLAEIKSRPVTPIEPVFVDYTKDMGRFSIKKNIPVLYKQNTENPLFSLYYVYDMGNDHDKALGTAFSYLNFLGTSTKTAEQIKSELYKLACSFGVSSSTDRVYVYINGLHDNFDQAMGLLEELLADAQTDMDKYNNLVGDILKERTDNKLNQQYNYSRLSNYGIWGSLSPTTNILSEKELKSMNPQELVNRTKNLRNYEHRIMYYGPLSEKEITAKLNDKHGVADQFLPFPEPIRFVQQDITENTVLLAQYDAKQIYMSMLHQGGTFDKNLEPIRKLYNEYFGGGMNSIVFQEMREARGLAYSAWAGYSHPGKPDRAYYLQTFIATQNDKMGDAVDAFKEILNDMPVSEKAFQIAKENMLTNLRTERILREDIFWYYLSDEEFGYTEDSRKPVFEKLPSLTLTDVQDFQMQYVKDKPFTYCILGDIKDLDMARLKSMGTVKILTQEEIFGY
ncbi:MAG: insulinase family protein [Tannerella sp.]|jgi:predicted Zn-dependent peptidase|nr:insulinase family protein [Tannerella sp.]